MRAVSRLFAGEVAEKVASNGIKMARGCSVRLDDLHEKLNALNFGTDMENHLADMDLVAAELVK